MEENKPGVESQSFKLTFNEGWGNKKTLIKEEYIKNKEKKIQKNLETLRKKSEELNEPIPDELLVVVAGNLMVGASFFDKYEKWLK